MEVRTIREVAYRSHRTVQMKRKAYEELFFSTCQRFPMEAEYPQYQLIPVQVSDKQPVKVSSTRTTQKISGIGETIKELQNSRDKNLSKSKNNDNHLSDEEENINEMYRSDVESSTNEDSDNDETCQVMNGGRNEFEKRYLGNFNSNVANNDNDIESEESQDETGLFEVTDDSSDDESDRDQNNQYNVENVDENSDVDVNENCHAEATPLSVKRGKIVKLKNNVREDSILMCIIAIAVRHCLNLITIITLLKYIGKILLSNTIPKSKRAMWRRKRSAVKNNSMNRRFNKPRLRIPREAVNPASRRLMTGDREAHEKLSTLRQEG
ncbi:putative uncharacterized protein DDB_G0285495 [Venturia canescens]|uniref:putative uncharacterized protein DDB_G0285495 n=1 Tax=Venturia canescens TaxID=32260 RepID=UPI001C9D478C|nr:putative uncharacterized protein DDB_G0285495 [Venturia canescens]